MRFSFDVYGQPATEGSTRAYPYRKPDGTLGSRIVHDNPKLHAWREAVGWAAKARKPPGWPTGGPMAVEATFRIPRPKSHYTRGKTPLLRPDAPPRPTGHSTGDLDKLVRALGDSLTGITWDDDSQIVTITAHKHWHATGTGALTCTVEHVEEGQP